MSQIDEIKDRLDIVEVISGYVPLKRAGRNYKGLCPFHAEKTPSFVVFPDSGTWHCFGACNTGGDVFNFIMKRENLDFGEALRLLAAKAGVVLEERRPRSTEEQSRLDQLYEIHAAATTYYHHMLMQSPRAETARAYVTRRGLNQETLTAFGLGYAPNEWDALMRYLTGKGLTVEALMEAGLLVEREDGGHYDRFRHRLMIPIRDRRGRPIGFGARALDESLPKYLNSPQTPLFDKSAVLFGLDRAAKGIRGRNEAVIVEGYMDVLACHQYGADNVIATMGTALTEAHLFQLSKLAERIVLALDPDAAGDQATLRGLHLARQTIGRRKVPTLTARGAVQHEERLLVDLRILSLPAGKDPDEVIREEGLAGWNARVSQAQPLVEYLLNLVVGKADLNDPRSKSAAVQEMKPILLELADDIERHDYVQRLARRLRLDETTVEREVLGERPARRLARSEPRKRRGPAIPQGLVDDAMPAFASAAEFGAEEQCVVYLARTPGLIHTLSFAFAEGSIPFLEPEDFSRPENRAIYACLKDNAEAGDLMDAERLRGTLEQPLAEYLAGLLEAPGVVPHLSDEECSEDLTRCALRLKRRSLRQKLDRLYYLLEEPEEASAQNCRQLIQDSLLALQQIDRTLHARSMIGRRASLEPKA